MTERVTAPDPAEAEDDDKLLQALNRKAIRALGPLLESNDEQRRLEAVQMVFQMENTHWYRQNPPSSISPPPSPPPGRRAKKEG